MRRALLWTAVLLAMGLGAVARAQAAFTGQAVLWQVRLAAYPQVDAWVSVYGPDGFFAADLPAEAFTITEAGAPRPVDQATVEHPGLHIALALNPARAFTRRDVQGIPRHLYLFYQLQTWLESEQKGRHDLSLIALNGPTVTHTDDPIQVLDALTDYYALQSKTFRDMQPELTPLVHAITQASAPSPRPGMGRVVLFITASIDGLQPQDLDLPLRRAQDAQVRVWVWLVGPANLAQSAQGRLWADFAAATGGQFLVFSGQEVLPDLTQAFAALDGVYRLTYSTAQTQPGAYPVRVAVQGPFGTLTTQERLLDLNLTPPQVRWLVPPHDVTRQPPAPDAPPETWEPTTQTVEVAVTFPEGQNRPLARSALWVDGEKVAERTAPPFERLEWDLRAYAEPGQHTLQVEVEDVLGLVGASPEVQVAVQVAPAPSSGAGGTPPGGPTAAASGPATATTTPTPARAARTSWAPVALGAGVVLAALVGGLFWAWRVGALRVRGTGRPARSPSPKPQGWAVLEPLPPLEPDWPTPPRLVLQADEVVLGSDPAQATLVLDDRSVSPQHARLWRDDQGRAFVADLHSLAGTWVNYAPVSAQGAALEPGDVLFVGRLGFRFTRPQEEA